MILFEKDNLQSKVLEADQRLKNLLNKIKSTEELLISLKDEKSKLEYTLNFLNNNKLNSSDKTIQLSAIFENSTNWAFNKNKAYIESENLRGAGSYTTHINPSSGKLTLINNSPKRQIYRQVAKENSGLVLTTEEILQKVRDKGLQIKKETHFANLSIFSKDPNMLISRVSLGKYFMGKSLTSQKDINE